MPSVTALRRWLVFVALLRLLSGNSTPLIPCDSDIVSLHLSASGLQCRHDCEGYFQTCSMLPDSWTPVFVHCAVYLGIFEVKYFQSNLFDLHPDSGGSLY